MVISFNLDKNQEAELMAILKSHSNLIRWTVIDIEGINTLICTHHIYLEDDAKPSRHLDNDNVD